MSMDNTLVSDQAFASTIVRWHHKHGRHHLPWQNTQDRYKVWVSEIMLQQTQVATVIDYYQKFMQHYPTLNKLASANIDDVLQHWAGLGYYRRAKYLHMAAKIMINEHRGIPPTDPKVLATLPGIGKSTANAICSLANNLPYPILDGNVKRIFARFFGIYTPQKTSLYEKELWALAEKHLSKEQARIYNQALMDIGSSICLPKKPQCDRCPLNTLGCYAQTHDQITRLPQINDQKKVKKTKKHIFMLILLSKEPNTRVFLIQRDDTSFWPRLWVLPFFDSEEELNEHIDKKSTLQKHATITHQFTHIHWNITPIEVSNEHDNINIKGQWVTKKEIKNLATPAPVAIILNEVFKANP